ncbi:hypothetical protein HDU96_008966 [Phlyctochytrium bullatum]|nr:hypothetical protein HDU96_008966 [Phlyctochytrium bullatum]
MKPAPPRAPPLLRHRLCPLALLLAGLFFLSIASRLRVRLVDVKPAPRLLDHLRGATEDVDAAWAHAEWAQEAVLGDDDDEEVPSLKLPVLPPHVGQGKTVDPQAASNKTGAPMPGQSPGRQQESESDAAKVPLAAGNTTHAAAAGGNNGNGTPLQPVVHAGKPDSSTQAHSPTNNNDTQPAAPGIGNVHGTKPGHDADKAHEIPRKNDTALVSPAAEPESEEQQASAEEEVSIHPGMRGPVADDEDSEPKMGIPAADEKAPAEEGTAENEPEPEAADKKVFGQPEKHEQVTASEKKPSHPAATQHDPEENLLTPETDTDSTNRTLTPLPPGFVSFPKLIWSYWHDGNPPAFVRDIMFGWARFNPDFRITIITRTTISSHISIRPPPTFDAAIIPHQADWVRLAVLMEHGGFWLDASLVTTRSLGELRVRQRRQAVEAWERGDTFNGTRAEAFQYYISGFTRWLEAPVMESWFIASVPRGRYITAMFMEFNFAMANFKVNEGYVEHLRRTVGDKMYEDKIRQGNVMESYLIIHLCSTKVVAIDGVPPPMTENAELGPNRFEQDNGWNDWEAARALRRNYTFPTPLTVKLRGGFRDSLIRQLRAGEGSEPGSVYARFVAGSEEIVMRGKGGEKGPVEGIREVRPPEIEERRRRRRDGERVGWMGWVDRRMVVVVDEWKDGVGVGEYGEAPWEVVGSKIAKPWWVVRESPARR